MDPSGQRPTMGSGSAHIHEQGFAECHYMQGGTMLIDAKRTHWVAMAASLAALTLGAGCTSGSKTSPTGTGGDNGGGIPPEITLTALSMSSGGAQLAKGTTGRFFVTAAYSDLTVRDVSGEVAWASSDPAVLQVNAGVAKGLLKGSAVVSATLSGKTARVGVTVTDAELVSIAVTPGIQSMPKGTSARLHATGSYTDGTTQDVTSSASWS